jgi:hypothetical protein
MAMIIRDRGGRVECVAPDGRCRLVMPKIDVRPVVGAIVCGSSRGDDIAAPLLKARGVVTSVHDVDDGYSLILWPVFVPVAETPDVPREGLYACKTWAIMEAVYGYAPGTPATVSRDALVMTVAEPPPRRPYPHFLEGFIETFGYGVLASVSVGGVVLGPVVDGLHGEQAYVVCIMSRDAAEDEVAAAEAELNAARAEMTTVITRVTAALKRCEEARASLEKFT